MDNQFLFLDSEAKRVTFDIEPISKETEKGSSPAQAAGCCHICPDCRVRLVRLGNCFSCPLCGFGGCG